MKVYDSCSHAYAVVLADLLDDPDWTISPRGQVCHEIMNYSFTVSHPSAGPIVTRCAERNATMAAYLETELRLYLSGEDRAVVWAAEASKFWAKLANDDGTINSNYGLLAFYKRSLPGGWTPWRWAVESLIADPDTRQAYVRFALPEHQFWNNKDQVCTMHMMFMRRQGKIHGTTVMRSNDAVKGLAYDMPWFCYLLGRMAEEIDVPMGTYTHVAHSMHLYEKDVEIARRMIGC